VLGAVEVCRDGEPVPLGPPKQRLLLAVMLCRPGEMLSVDGLTDAL
jgi:DNA-binding SARP family transcriptional activator